MPNYRRAIVPGGTFFFTVVTWQRRPVLCNPDLRAALREAITNVRGTHPVTIDAWVLLHDHLHCVWTLPDGDGDFAVRWAMIKRFVTRRTGFSGGGAQSAPYEARPHCVSRSRLKRHEGRLWQRRFWEHQVRDLADLKRCLDYLHWNPVKHGLVARVADWPYSTFHRWVNDGMYPVDWGGEVVRQIDGRDFGE
jgi:putative transposase